MAKRLHLLMSFVLDIFGGVKHCDIFNHYMNFGNIHSDKCFKKLFAFVNEIVTYIMITI